MPLETLPARDDNGYFATVYAALNALDPTTATRQFVSDDALREIDNASATFFLVAAARLAVAPGDDAPAPIDRLIAKGDELRAALAQAGFSTEQLARFDVVRGYWPALADFARSLDADTLGQHCADADALSL